MPYCYGSWLIDLSCIKEYLWCNKIWSRRLGRTRTLPTKVNGNPANNKARASSNTKMVPSIMAHGLIIRDTVKEPCVGKPRKEPMSTWAPGNKI